jgi:hypothetical protein
MTWVITYNDKIFGKGYFTKFCETEGKPDTTWQSCDDKYCKHYKRKTNAEKIAEKIGTIHEQITEINIEESNFERRM